MSEGPSKLGQQLHRNFYSRHRERLADIRPYIPTKDLHFLPKRSNNNKGPLGK
jgi:hypothetical protein